MGTAKQKLGEFGAQRVVLSCSCPRCKRSRTLKLLPANFKCADIICDFCGFTAQVKTASSKSKTSIPNRILGAAWGPQKERMDAGIYIPLFIVVVEKETAGSTIFYLAGDLQIPKMFRPRRPLSSVAKRAGWQGFTYDMEAVKGSVVRLA